MNDIFQIDVKKKNVRIYTVRNAKHRINDIGKED